jgi:hypothetical protein
MKENQEKEEEKKLDSIFILKTEFVGGLEKMDIIQLHVDILRQNI